MLHPSIAAKSPPEESPAPCSPARGSARHRPQDLASSSQIIDLKALLAILILLFRTIEDLLIFVRRSFF
jgi:hypothetical protein